MKKQSMSHRKKRDELISRCLVLYSLGLDYSQYADELSAETSEKEWDVFLQRLHQVDEWMVAAGCGTLAQIERFNARRENRHERLHSLMTDRERSSAITEMSEELKAAGIRFGDFVFIPANLDGK
jgi:hypothetical protein